ncbi:MAG: glycosyltransferase family 1 protein [Dorea sp.]|nr:glycosyltransferase family 1 protein [Dorea sp.]
MMTGNRIKILHMTPVDINNGVYRYIFNHMGFMDMQKYQFAFLTKGAEALRQTSECRKYGFPVHMLQNTQRDSREGLKEEVIRVLGRGYDAIHLHTSSWRGFLIEQTVMEMGIGQVIVHSHSTGIDVPDDRERQKQTEEHERYKSLFSMEYATDVCACSALAADWLYGPGVPADRIQILPNAIDVERYHFHPEKRRQIREALNLGGRIVIGNTGRYSYQKNQEFLIRAFARAHERNPALFLLCLGEGEQLGSLKRLAGRLDIGDSVLCMDWRNNPEDYLQGMDLFCLPSRFEGLPISAIEAQAAGLRCLVSDCVTGEVRITDLVTFLPLDEMLWAEELAGCRINEGRDRQDEKIAGAGYDIRTAAERLEELYKKGG